MMKLIVVFLLCVTYSFAQISVKAKRVGDTIEVWGINTFIFDATVEVKTTTKFLKSDRALPLTTVLKAKSKRKVLSFTIVDKKRFTYKSKYHWVIGSKDAKHDDSYIYRLPFKLGTKQMVSQGFNGKFTHFGMSQYAVDFDFKVGTEIYAARDGLVVKTKADSKRGGPHKRYLKDANQITIEHSDGTLATYNHLKYQGVKVKVGQRVKRGAFLGYSGKTGYARGAHLHFIVYKAIDGNKRVSFPVKFKSTRGVVTQPKNGVYYEAM